MIRLPMFCGLGILFLALLVGTGTSQDAKKDQTKAKGKLPDGFKDLGLSKEQIAKIYSVQADYKVKLAELEKKVKEMKSQESQDIFKVLTDAQREKYLKSKGVETKDKASPSDKAADKKPDEKDKKDADKKSDDKK